MFDKKNKRLCSGVERVKPTLCVRMPLDEPVSIVGTFCDAGDGRIGMRNRRRTSPADLYTHTCIYLSRVVNVFPYDVLIFINTSAACSKSGSVPATTPTQCAVRCFAVFDLYRIITRPFECVIMCAHENLDYLPSPLHVRVAMRPRRMKHPRELRHIVLLLFYIRLYITHATISENS